MAWNADRNLDKIAHRPALGWNDAMSPRAFRAGKRLTRKQARQFAKRLIRAERREEGC